MSNEMLFPAVHDRISILDFIRRHLTPDGLPDSEMNLPDEPESRSEITWIAGALDGMALSHTAKPDVVEFVAEAMYLLRAALVDLNAANLTALYSHLNNNDTIGFVDELLSEIRLDPFVLDRVAEVARWLCEHSPDRGPTKVGIALMGATGNPDADVLRDLGSHETFTLYSVVAMTNSFQDSEWHVFEIAKRTNGWGRINCVRRLRRTIEPEIKWWLLHEGFRNGVMDEYLAYIAATTGGLLDALQADDLSPGTIKAAGDILVALITGGPAEDIRDYVDGPAVIDLYVRLASAIEPCLRTYLVIGSVARFLKRESGWERCLSGWTEASRSKLGQRCEEILRRPVWINLTNDGLKSRDSKQFWISDRAASRLGIDTFDPIMERLRNDPHTHLWHRAWAQADDGRAQQLVDLAEAEFDLAAIAVGASPSTGTGPEFKLNWTIQHTVRGLERFPGIGQQIIEAVLQSPSVMNRIAALRVLKAWTRETWSPELRDLVAGMAADDPDERLQGNALLLLAT